MPRAVGLCPQPLAKPHRCACQAGRALFPEPHLGTPPGRLMCPHFGPNVPPASPVCAPSPDGPPSPLGLPRNFCARHRPKITPSNPPNPPRGEVATGPRSAFRAPAGPIRPTSACVERTHMQHSFVHGRPYMTIEPCTHPQTSETPKTPQRSRCTPTATACSDWRM